jgi:NAD(P)-dependent dehydrogenase (short-subunit alcohol dehydrogenase family)
MKKTSKTILITGASSGFGRDMAETLAADGHKVYGGVHDSAGPNSAAALFAERASRCRRST